MNKLNKTRILLPGSFALVLHYPVVSHPKIKLGVVQTMKVSLNRRGIEEYGTNDRFEFAKNREGRLKFCTVKQ